MKLFFEDAQKTDQDRQSEQQLLDQMMEIVEERNDIIENMTRDENRFVWFELSPCKLTFVFRCREVEEYHKLISKVIPQEILESGNQDNEQSGDFESNDRKTPTPSGSSQVIQTGSLSKQSKTKSIKKQISKNHLVASMLKMGKKAHKLSKEKKEKQKVQDNKVTAWVKHNETIAASHPRDTSPTPTTPRNGGNDAKLPSSTDTSPQNTSSTSQTAEEVHNFARNGSEGKGHKKYFTLGKSTLKKLTVPLKNIGHHSPNHEPQAQHSDSSLLDKKP